MKKITKFFAVLLITVLSITSTVFAETETTLSNSESINAGEALVYNSFAIASEDFVKFSIENNTGFIKEAYQNYLSMIENGKLGAFEKFEGSTIEHTKTGYIFQSNMVFAEGKVKVTVKYEKFHQSYASVVDVDFENIDTENKSMLDKMANAAINTLIGMTTVVLVLLLISWLIGLFKFIPVLQEKFANKGKKTSAADTAIDNAIAQITEKEELADDTELVAVITAAICAATGTSSDGFVVRSIRKARRNK
jgi:Na+-transporting methylmalonyl-CoA/oxaloacetate decarboxylase gamma subunit